MIYVPVTFITVVTHVDYVVDLPIALYHGSAHGADPTHTLRLRLVAFAIYVVTVVTVDLLRLLPIYVVTRLRTTRYGYAPRLRWVVVTLRYVLLDCVTLIGC